VTAKIFPTFSNTQLLIKIRLGHNLVIFSFVLNTLQKHVAISLRKSEGTNRILTESAYVIIVH